MPELPEVETVLRGVAPHLTGQIIEHVTVRQPRLRTVIPPTLPERLYRQHIRQCRRRAKYLLFDLDYGTLLIHLGMSGSLRFFSSADTLPEAGKHDHVDIFLQNGSCLRYHDPRRFGMLTWFDSASDDLPLLGKLGSEPLSEHFDAEYLYTACTRSSRSVKNVLMDQAVVVGVGNIYANESLFLAGISPKRTANQLSRKECGILVETIRQVLQAAITKGGSTLRDFVDSAGNSGYFQQEYTVYGRTGLPCPCCGHPIEKTVIGQRGTFYCPYCQH